MCSGRRCGHPAASCAGVASRARNAERHRETAVVHARRPAPANDVISARRIVTSPFHAHAQITRLVLSFNPRPLSECPFDTRHEARPSNGGVVHPHTAPIPRPLRESVAAVPGPCCCSAGLWRFVVAVVGGPETPETVDGAVSRVNLRVIAVANDFPRYGASGVAPARGRALHRQPPCTPSSSKRINFVHCAALYRPAGAARLQSTLVPRCTHRDAAGHRA